jgi:hypothetical protein
MEEMVLEISKTAPAGKEHTKLRARESKATVADSDFEEDKAFHG